MSAQELFGTRKPAGIKRIIWPLIAITSSAAAILLALALWKAQDRETPAPDPAHAVAQIDIALAKRSWAESCGASNPQILFAIETYPSDEAHLRSLSPAQRDLLREVAWRLAGADSGYTEMFFADNHPQVEWDDGAIVKAAAGSTNPSGQGPAARALQEIEAGASCNLQTSDELPAHGRQETSHAA
jgi:hypothetical protein